LTKGDLNGILNFRAKASKRRRQEQQTGTNCMNKGANEA
jgi:hypothetical protein